MKVENFTSKLMEDMDPDLLAFVKTKVNSFVKWDLLRFFHENPHTLDTVSNIARYAGRGEAEVQAELDALVREGLMERHLMNDTPVYGLTSDEEMRRLLDKFFRACEDRHFRVKVVYHIIRGK